MDIIRPGDPNYNIDRQISNARFDLKPASIYYCEKLEHVKQALADARKPNVYYHIRLRSGGHQHEGLCSGDGVLLLDVSRMAHITPDKPYRGKEKAFQGEETAWIGPGTKLQKIYGTMFGDQHLFSGGGCGDVCIGGLVQGGGWGLYSRKLGLTCDRLIGFEMVTVTADGKLLVVSVDDQQYDKQYDELFWAVRGAGGGNFGVITDLKFALAKKESEIWQFTAKWEHWEDVQSVTEQWIKTFPGDKDWNLTTFCRLSADGDSQDPPLVISGNYLGTKAALDQTLKRLLESKYDANKISYSQVEWETGKIINPTNAYQPGPSLANTCAGNPFRHKVSSCFPTSKFGPDAVRKIVEYLRASPFQVHARSYVSLHSMGGFINSNDNPYKSQSCFPYRAKPFMVQYQAWWQPLSIAPNPDSFYLQWVATFRDQMKSAGYTEGAFINFPDRDIALPDYYAGNYPRLRQVKLKYDPKNWFNSEMSIPLP